MSDKQKTNTVDYFNLDPFNEEKAERKYLNSKPTCFIIIGKPGSGKTTLARKLAQAWKCEFVNGNEVINMAIEMQTELGIKAQEILLRGEAIPEELSAKMLLEKINSPEVAHHGYILDGFPSLSEDWLSLADQLELVKNLPMPPDFIINIKIPDKDLAVRRQEQKLDPLTGMLYARWEYAPEPVYSPDAENVGEDEEGMEEEEEVEEEEEEILEEVEDYPEDEEKEEPSPELIERLVTRPEDLPQNVTASIKHYKDMILRTFEDYMADHDQQKLIELDGNESQKVLFKHLMMKLNTFVLNRALVPLRLQGSEDSEEISDDTDNDDLLRTLAATEMIAPKFRWRRSKWGRNCPVELKEGNIVPGNVQYSVSFLDKLYIMSTSKALGQFMRNPRPYLAPHLPRPPCKACVLGPPYSGKTEVARRIAERYKAKILDIDELVKPRKAAAKKKMMDETKAEAIQSAIGKVTAARQALKAEQGDEDEEHKTGDEEDEDEDEDEKEEETTAEKTEGEKDEEDKKEGEEEKSETGESKEDEEPEEPAEKPRKKSKDELPIDANHPDVIKIVNDVMAEAEKKEPELTPEEYVEVLDEAIQKRSEELLAEDSDGPSAGSYVLDNFPRTREHFSAMVERNIIPDEVIWLKDESENGELLLKRWYASNKQELHAKWEERRAAERAKKEAERLEKERIRKEEEAAKAAEEARRTAEAEAIIAEAKQLRGGEEEGEASVAAEESEDKTPEEQKPEEVEEKEESSETASPDPKGSTPRPSEEDPEGEGEGEGEEELSLDKDIPPETPETEEYRRQRTSFDRDSSQLLSVIKGLNAIEPINISAEKNLDDIATDVIKKVEVPFNYRAWEYTGMDQDEEEEDADEDEEDDEEDGDPFNRERKKLFGDSKLYCPVMLKERNVLWPGTVECAAKYRERTYFFSAVEARTKFLEDPESYLSADTALEKPPIRLIILGPKGAGKTLHGRYLAQKLGLFHVSFTERLQEMIIAKTKKKIGPDYDDEEEGTTDPESATDDPTATKNGENAPGVEGGEENNEEPEVELTEDEENIKANLTDGDPIPNETLDKILPEWWNEEPFRSTGFILEGFPRNELEARYLATSGYFPDAAILLAVEDTEIVNRLIPPMLEKWKRKRDKRQAEKERQKALARKQKEELRNKRREEKLAQIAANKAELLARRQARESDDSDEELEEEEEEVDIEALLDAEFEEEEEEEDEDEETEEDAIERMKTEIGDRFDEEVGRLANVQETFEELLIPRLEINGGRKPRIVRFCIEKAIRPIVDFRECLFDRCFAIDFFLANKMLSSGYKFPSRFGRWCPVKLLEGEVIQPQYGSLYYPCPVVYRQHVYFCCNEESREKFMQCPANYLKQPSPKPVVPIRIAIIGPPKSGKTTLAKRFASEYGVVRLSIGEALRRLLENQKNTELIKQINMHLRTGNTVPDELAVQALEVVLLDMQCQNRGFVLDGYPVTAKQVELMTERKLIPVKVLELKVDDEEVLRRGMIDRNDPARILPLHDSHQILAIRLNCWQQEVGAVRDWYDKEHRNWIALNGQRSKWWVWNEALDETRKSVRRIQIYLDRISSGKAASVADMCITQSELKSRLGDFRQYCPVSLADRGELVDCSVTPSLDFAAEFRGRYYKLSCRADLEKFLADPARYVPPLAPRKLPDELPVRRTSADVKAMFPIQIEMQGYCPVTFWDGKQRYESIVAGDPELVVEYKGKLYYFANEERLDKFMRLPELYHGLKLPYKLPPKKDSLSVNGLPMLGYMEQTVSTAISKALTAVGCFKPKYPYLNAKRSALLYVAYHLKAYNPNSSEYSRKKYKQKLMNFEEQCDLIKYLGHEMSSRYREPDERPIDFDHKLDNFLSLKGLEA